MINIYTLGMEIEPNNNDECLENTNCPSDGAESTTNEPVPDAAISGFLECIDNGDCLQNGLDFHRTSPSNASVGNRSPIADLKLNSVESTILSSGGSSRESSLSPQMILSNQHSRGEKDMVSFFF